MGLRFRLNLLLSLIFLVALATAVGYLLANARQAVVDELRASTELASTLLEGILASHLSAADEAGIEAMLRQLEAQAAMRHLQISRVTVGTAATDRRAHGSPSTVPAWFAQLVRPEPAMLTRQLGQAQNRIVIAADPDDEIGEAWRETRTTLGVLLAVFAGALFVVFTFLGRALAPLKSVSRALEGIEKGDFGARLPNIGLPDIDTISERFNHMAEALERSHADNAMLARRSLAIQEEERRHLAHELHDEMGQSITAIKALAVSIRERTEHADRTLAERAATIANVSSDIYARVRQMMTRLHPVILDELGLVAAVEMMVDDWNTHHADCFCRFDAARDLSVPARAPRIGLYRVVQEALTNIAKHAGPSTAEVRLQMAADGSAALILEVRDNGRGFQPAAQRGGLGLRGIRERVDAMGGTLELVTAPDQGVTIRVRVPRERILHKEDHDGEPDAHPAG